MANDSKMGDRGVSRPMAEHEMQHSHQGDGHGQHGMDRMHMMKMHHGQTLWIYWSLIVIGIWLAMSPLTFSYGQHIVEPSGGRVLWLSDEARVAFAKWNDIICGALLVVLGWRSLLPNRPVSLWVACFIGIWLNFAPVIFWAPSAVVYYNQTFVGALIIALTILIPGMPNMIRYMKMGAEVPRGWSYNPSSWPQRWIMLATAFLGWVVSRYLGAYQMGYIESVWDPFFGNGSALVLDSNMSHSLPVSDGALGALAYTFEFLMGWMGSPKRWRTMPWMVTFFGILVIPLGLVHIFLVISQPVIVGHWCTFCLLAAAIMLPMIPLEIDEVVAMFQHMKQAKKRGENLWRVFWKGGEPAEENMDERTPPLMDFPKRPGAVIRSAFWGMSVPWNLTASTFIGIFLMFAPALFGVDIERTVADISHLGGSLIIVVSVICMGEVVRRGRFLNILLGLIVAAGPWFFEMHSLALNLANTVLGAAVTLLAFRRGPKRETYGFWDKYVK